jgi:integrase
MDRAEGATSPPDVTARHVREYLAELAATGKSDNTVHDHARAIRTLLRFWHAEGYVSELVTFAMPKVAKKRLPVLDPGQLQTVLGACNVRDRAIVLLMADSGLRRSEVTALDWADVDFPTGN